MESQTLLETVSRGESTSIEFKRCGARPEEDTFQTVCSFANHMGGSIFLGVEDDGKIVGVPEGAATDIQRNIANVARNPKLFDPAVMLETEVIQTADAVVRLRDVDRYDDRLVVKTNLIDAYDVLTGFCERHLPDPFVLEDGARLSVRGIVCRELISNLLIHREFTSSYPAKLTISRNGLRTENASRTFFEGSITLRDFSPMPKNPSIANVFTQIGLAEELGSGTRNLFRYSRAFMGADPSLVDGSTFTATIPDAFGLLAGGEAPARKRPGIDDTILGLASSVESFTLAQAAEAAGVSKRSASSHISALIEAGMLIGEGSTRDRRYRRR